MSLTYRRLILDLHEKFRERENAVNEIRWLIEAFSGQDLPALDLDAEVADSVPYERAAERLEKHEPFQYVIGMQQFYGYDFFVDPSVLIPRPETELLVEKAVLWGKGKEVKALDLCTGCGCIAIALARELKGSFLAADISEKALATAEKNNTLNGTKVEFRLSDLFSRVEPEPRFDLITANPPYLTQKEMTEIPLEVSHEPEIALNGGGDGVRAIEGILKDVDRFLAEGGLFLMEIGETQGETVLSLAEKYGLENVGIEKDLNGKDRIFRLEK